MYSFDNEGLITYQKGYCGENGTLSFIIEKTDNKQEGYKPIILFGNIVIETDGNSVKFGDAIASLDKNSNTYIVICKWNRNTFTQEITAYPYTYPTDVPAYKLKPEMYRFDFSVIEENGVCAYNNDNITEKQSEVIVLGYPFNMTNIKLYNTYLSNEQAIKESMKYTTTNKACVFNDLARPLDTGLGYSPK
jgi:hypothetical protein